jgi:O-antigen/teichoic acid export membrane protein
MRFAAAVALARFLTVEEFGAFNVCVALVGVVVVVVRLGLPDVGARDAAADARGRGVLAGRVVGVQLAALGTVVAAVVAVTALLFPSTVPLVVAGAAAAAGMCGSADWLLRASERPIPLALATAVGGIAVAAFALLAVPRLPTTLTAVAGLAVGELLAAALTWRYAGVAIRLRLEGSLALVRRAWPLALSSLVVYSYYANIDTVLLAVTRSTREAGLYSAPYRVFLSLNVVGLFAAYGMLPAAARAATAQNWSAIRTALMSRFGRLAGFGAVCLGVIEVASEPMLRLLFGQDFGAMRSTFILLAIAVPWYTVGFPAGYLLIAGDENRRFLRGAAVAGGINVALNIALIPVFGTVGAAIATTIAMVGGALTWLQSQVGLRSLARLLIALTALSAGGVIAAASTVAAIPVAVATGGIGFFLLLRRVHEAKA